MAARTLPRQTLVVTRLSGGQIIIWLARARSGTCGAHCTDRLWFSRDVSIMGTAMDFAHRRY